MEIAEEILSSDERALFALRQLYRNRGYERYKMGKFEEYDLYARNKQFLVDENVITFTDVNGKLMALKPDVTLSIIKSTPDRMDARRKVYYNENVYRVPKGEHAFKEIMQAGLECIGDIDSSTVCEVVELAVSSLLCLSDEVVLDISHMGLVAALLDSMQLGVDDRSEMLRLLESRSIQGINALCAAKGVAEAKRAVLNELATCYGAPAEVFPKLSERLALVVPQDVWNAFSGVMEALVVCPWQRFVRVNFSLVNDADYYDGFVFTGYVKDIPQRVLSGGQYDGLMRCMNRSACAIGFAVYLDLLDFIDDGLLAQNEGVQAKEKAGA